MKTTLIDFAKEVVIHLIATQIIHHFFSVSI